jgi:hypothetical protein
LNKSKQQETVRLAGLLERVLQIVPDNNGEEGLDSLSGKSLLRNFIGDYQKHEKSTL